MGIGAILLALGIYLFIGVHKLDNRIPILKSQYKKEMKNSTLEEKNDILQSHTAAVVLLIIAWPFFQE